MLMSDFKKYLEQFDDSMEVFTSHGDTWAEPCVEFVPFDDMDGIIDFDHYIICSSGENVQVKSED